MKKLIILDRDGVINHDSDAFIKSADEWMPIEGSIEAIRKLKQAGWLVAVATNQSGIAREYYSRQDLQAMHQKFMTLLGDVKVDWIAYAPYLSNANSPARKPGIGMIQSIEKALGVNAKNAVFVGDTLGDMQAARRAKMLPMLVRTGKGERTLATKDAELADIPVYDDLAAVVEQLI